MTPFVWTPDLSVGVNEIDIQHRELFRRIDSLVKALDEGRATGEVATLFDFLDDYIGSHFTTEVKCMHIFSYPGMGAQRVQHDIFVNAVKRARADYEASGPTEALVNDLMVNVCDWLVNHVRTVDMELGRFLKERGGLNLSRPDA